MSGRGVLALGIAMCLGVLGCDDGNKIPAALLRDELPAEPEEPPRPTTQELLSGPRTPVVLDLLPLRMHVPPQWKITRHGSGAVTLLEGPTPHSHAQISLKYREPMPLAQYEAYLTGLERAKETSGDTVRTHTAGPMQIIERTHVSPETSETVKDAAGMPILNEQGELTVVTFVPMRWWVHCFVPMGDRVEQYELNFMALTKEQFDQDQQFLEEMLATLTYIGPQPTAPTSPPDAPATQPVED